VREHKTQVTSRWLLTVIEACVKPDVKKGATHAANPLGRESTPSTQEKESKSPTNSSTVFDNRK